MISPPPTVPCSAPLLFAHMRAATGGDAWNRIGQTTALGTVRVSGLNGAARLSYDRDRGRYAERYDVEVMGASAEIYDGNTVWSQDISGGVHPLNADFARKRAVTGGYLNRQAYFDPRSDATFRCIGTAHDGERNVILVRVQPHNGIPAVLSIDAQSHLLASVSERLPTTTDITRFADYRQVGAVALPFEIVEYTESEPENGTDVNVRRYELFPQPLSQDFQKPKALNPGRILAASSTTVPLKIEGRQLLVWASINGHAAMPFILDTGGHAILTALAAKTLGLHGNGAGVSGGAGAGTVALQYTPVRTVRIGNAEISDQRFLVIPYPYSFYDRGRKPPLAGILGLEVFERFAVRIDYGRQRLTLAEFPSFTPATKDASVPIHFQEDMPLAPASVDGHAGTFGIDTGNAGSVVLFNDYLTRTGLLGAYPGGTRATGSGTGGTNTGRVVRVRQFTFGGSAFENISSYLTNMQSGSFSSWTEAGNLGYEVLSRFVPTFDYAAGTIYLEHSPFAHEPPPNRAGMVFGKSSPQALDVVAVRRGSAAADADIIAGDKIVGVNGKDATWYSSADLYDMVTQAAGTVITLRVVHNGTARTVAIRLR